MKFIKFFNEKKNYLSLSFFLREETLEINCMLFFIICIKIFFNNNINKLRSNTLSSLLNLYLALKSSLSKECLVINNYWMLYISILNMCAILKFQWGGRWGRKWGGGWWKYAWERGCCSRIVWKMWWRWHTSLLW